MSLRQRESSGSFIATGSLMSGFAAAIIMMYMFVPQENTETQPSLCPDDNVVPVVIDNLPPGVTVNGAFTRLNSVPRSEIRDAASTLSRALGISPNDPLPLEKLQICLSPDGQQITRIIS